MSPRAAAAVAVAALVACGSYAVQRLVDQVGEPAMGAVLLQAHIPYYWRVGAAALHAGVAGSAAWASLGTSSAERLLERLPAAVVGVVLLSAAAMLVFP